MKRLIALLPREDWIVIGWVMAVKILLFVVAVESYAMLWDSYPPT